MKYDVKPAGDTGWSTAARAGRRCSGLLVASILLTAGSRAIADEQPSAPTATPTATGADEAALAAAAEAFELGKKLSKEAKWDEALAAFEEAAKVGNEPLLLYNIAFCKRALGRYVEARRTFRLVLANPGRLTPDKIAEARTLTADLDQLVVEVAVTMDPAGTPLFVDGRGLRVAEIDKKIVYVTVPGSPDPAKESSKAPYEGPTTATFTLELDPGPHTFRADLEGHLPEFAQHTYRAKARATLNLQLRLLPANVSVVSNPMDAVMLIDNQVARSKSVELDAGKYKVDVVKDDYEAYSTTLDLHAGQKVDLTATLQRRALVKKWQFWAVAVPIAAALIAGGIVTAVEIAKGPPPYDRGTLNWLATPGGASSTPRR